MNTTSEASESRTAATKSRMPKELKAKWLEALRSGRYDQGQGALEENGAYCCLGVLQMAADGEVEMDRYKDRAPAKYPSTDWAEKHGCKQNACPDGYLYDRFDPIVGHPTYSRGECLSELNDQGVEFARIADLIEEQVEGV